MKSKITINLMKMFEKCPNCGNDKIGNDQGTLIVGEETFERTCKCGYKMNMTLVEQFPQKK